MKRQRIWRLARAIETRYPESRVVVEQWGCPDDPSICWWIEVLNVRARDARAIQGFADDLVGKMYGDEEPTFFVHVSDRRQSREYLASRREKDRARRLRRRLSLAGRIAG
ncbi:MAG: hypothetical protein L0323_16685 [Planctomycetes bacterium]|nr:hypothetical protein [Planctomycetota bacterium]